MRGDKQFGSRERRFYVYAFLRHWDSSHGGVGSPYYIGKGTGRRAWRSYRRDVPKARNIVIIASNLPEIEALQLEMFIIFIHGRISLGTGGLRNWTDGGDGRQSGILQKMELEQRASAMRKMWSDPKLREQRCKSLKEAKAKRRETHPPKRVRTVYTNSNSIPQGRNAPKSEETKKRMSLAHLSRNERKCGTAWGYHCGCRCENCRAAAYGCQQKYKQNKILKKKLTTNSYGDIPQS